MAEENPAYRMALSMCGSDKESFTSDISRLLGFVWGLAPQVESEAKASLQAGPGKIK
jgi:hypothetical protein